jgi:adenine-specific DNA-methyltransferase
MARIEEKIAEISDPALRLSIAEEVANLKKHTRFGLVFEEHQPEFVPIYGKKIKRGERVAKKTGGLDVIWRVISIKNAQALCELEKRNESNTGIRETFPVEQLVIIRSMGEPIYPSLTPVDSVKNGDPSVPHHILIEADNYHALQLLLFPHEGKVDCIYIDPPYNTGARDWKYNNDYVDDNDAWQHSKWLTFMAKRLRLAKHLLNPDTGVLIVTIDEHEIHHLGCLLEQELPDSYQQTVTIVVNPKGVTQGRFSRVEEYALFCFAKGAFVKGLSDDLLTAFDPISANNKVPRWKGLLRSGTNARRQDRHKMFFPVLIDTERNAVVGAGDYLPLDETPDIEAKINGYAAAWPIRTDGSFGNWGVGPSTLRQLIDKGYVSAGGYDPKRKTWGFSYLSKKPQKQIETGALQIIAFDKVRNVVEVEYAEERERQIKTVWHRSTHDAGAYGADVLRSILGGSRKFSFPKSIYAVRDAIAAVVGDKPNALLVDFFAGSGTTLNAVNLLNATDGGQRQCILVTNNEVSEEEASALTAQGFQPGQDEWDRNGICQSVTWPRSKFTVLGQRDDGTPLAGDYLTSKQVSREKPRGIRQLGFAEGRHLKVQQRKQIAALLSNVPQNKVDASPWFIDDEITVSILWDIQHASDWLEELSEADHVTEIFVVTLENRLFASLKAQIVDTLGMQVLSEDEKRPMRDGFATNLEYFRLDFLDPQEIQMGRQFAAVLPVLWMMAGSRGARPDPPDAHAPWLLPNGCPFAVLIQETRFKEFVRHVESRADLTHVFIVTNSHDTVHKLRREWTELHVVQLYKDYLENFRINLSENPNL